MAKGTKAPLTGSREELFGPRRYVKGPLTDIEPIKKYQALPGQEGVLLTVTDLEAAYRLSFHRYLHVATAITGNADKGADAVQEGFARAIRLRHSFNGRGSLEGWLWRIIVNSARDQKRPSVLPLDVDLIAVPAVVDPPSHRVRDLVTGLPERQRLILFLRYYADLSYEAIAEVFEISPGTVGAALHAARTALRAQLEEVHR